MLKIILLIILMLSTKQIQVIAEPLHDFNILSGVTGSGKTFGVNLKWYETICNAPKNSLFLQSGNNEESVWDNITSELLKIDSIDRWLEYKGVANKKRIIVKHTGTQVVITGASTENAQDRIQGKSIDGWYADEIVKQPRSFVDMALSRCRRETVRESDGKKIMITTPAIWTCNPDSPSHYIKKQFIDNTGIDVKNWYFGFYDNPLITEEYINKVKMNFSGVFYDRMILGKWVAGEGAIYTEFSRDKHVVSEIPEMVEYMLAVDWGYENPLAILLIGMDSDNTYYVIDEISVKNQLVDESLRNLMTNKWGSIYSFDSSGYCDTNRPEQIRQLSDLFPKMNLVGATKDVIDGIQEVAKFFKIRGNARYGIYIHERCTTLITELENYRWRTNNKGIGKDEPLKENDHTCDALRYAIFSRRQNFDFGDTTIDATLRTDLI